MKNIAAIITARGGSKGLPGKNIRLLAGKPLIAHSIVAAQNAGIADVYVSSDSEEILAIARAYHAIPILRPAEFATDASTSQLPVRHWLEVVGAEKYSHLMLLQPTSPLRTADHIRAAMEMYGKSQAASLVSVCEESHHPYKSLSIVDHCLSPLMGQRAYLSTPRQELPRAYRQNGAIYLLSVADFIAHDSFFIEPALAYVMDKASSVDIDDEWDFMLAQAILSKSAA